MSEALVRGRAGWINRNVIGLATNRFLSDFGHEAGTALLPLFLTAIGAPALALGVIEGVADAASSLAKLFGGWLGDNVERRRPWAALGYLLTGVTTGLYGLFAALALDRSSRGRLGWIGRGLCARRCTTPCSPTRFRTGRGAAPSASTRPPTPPGRSPARSPRSRSSDCCRASTATARRLPDRLLDRRDPRDPRGRLDPSPGPGDRPSGPRRHDASPAAAR